VVAQAVEAVFARDASGLAVPKPLPALATRGILYPTADGLTDEQFEALSQATRSVGESVVFLSYAERYTNVEQAQDFEVGASDVAAYRSLIPSGMDHVLVSRGGAWGVYVLHEGAAVVAGSEEFVNRMYADLPSPIDQALGFVREIRGMRVDNANAWIRELLLDVLGPEAASGIWETAT
jgi:hypothetical protein